MPYFLQRVNERALHLAVPYFVAGLLFASLPRAAEISTVLAFIALMIIIACVQVRPHSTPKEHVSQLGDAEKVHGVRV